MSLVPPWTFILQHSPNVYVKGVYYVWVPKMGMKRVGCWKIKVKWEKNVTRWKYQLIEKENKNKRKERTEFDEI